MSQSKEGGTDVFQAPSQTQAAIRLKDYATSPYNFSLMEVERADGSRIPFRNDDELRMLAEGLLAQVCPRQLVTAQSVPAAGSLRLNGIYLKKGLVLTNGVVMLGNANGTGVTLAKIGIWKTDGTLQIATVDMSAGMNAGALPRAQVGALTAPWTVPADALYWAGIVQVSGTPASLGCSSGVSYGAAPLPGFPFPMAGLGGQTDAVSFAPAGLAGGSANPWVGFN